MKKRFGRLDRYAAPYGDFVTVTADPHSGPRRAKRAEEILRNQPRALPGYQGQSPWLVLSTAVVVVIVVSLARAGSAGQTPAVQPSVYRPPRTADGKPDFNGIWQALNTAAWDIQDHDGALGIPPGQGVVEGNEIPYQPWALKKKQENFANRMTADPETKCFMPGVPRGMYMPFPFEITQTPKYIVIAHEYAHASRTIYLDEKQQRPEGIDAWMGDSRGRWEGDTLVVDVSNFNGHTWFDRAGNFHSEALRVTERFTRAGPDHLSYEVTIDDPTVFTRRWKMSMPLYRRQEKNLRLLEYECVIYLQEEKWKTGLVKDRKEGAR